MRFWIRLLSSGSVTSDQSMSCAEALGRLLRGGSGTSGIAGAVVAGAKDDSGLLASCELTDGELCLILLDGILPFPDSLDSSFFCLALLASLTMWLGRRRGFSLFCVARRSAFPLFPGS